MTSKYELSAFNECYQSNFPKEHDVYNKPFIECEMWILNHFLTLLLKNTTLLSGD